MAQIGSYVTPVIVLIIVLFGFVRGERVFECFVSGAREAMKTAAGLFPTLLGLVFAVSMLRESGALEALAGCLGGVARLTGIPADVLPLTVLSPVSGSGSLTLFESILEGFGADSLEGRVASVIMGSTETTFYAVTVYYGAVGVNKTRCTIPACMAADITSYIVSAQMVRLLAR